jgi:hypothetical protein
VPKTPNHQRATRDVGLHDRRLARRLEDPEFRAEFERQRREIAAVDAIVNQLEALRAEKQISKAELARAIDKHPAAIRRLLTASGNPELRTVIALAEALDADLRLVARPATKPLNTGQGARPTSVSA